MRRCEDFAKWCELQPRGKTASDGIYRVLATILDEKYLRHHSIGLPPCMSEAELERLDEEWEKRAAPLGAALRQAFPLTLMDQACLRKLLEHASKPLTPKEGFFTRIYVRMFPSAWADTELLDFLKLLRDDDWTQIDWNSAWIVISILPLAALAYCLPGILYWILMDPNADAVATEALIDYNLPRLLSEQGTNGSWSHLFNAEQKHLIAETVRLVRDLTFAEDPPMQKAANDILLQMERSGASREDHP